METTKVFQRILDGADTVIHLGAGRCRELPEYLAAASKRIVLVEANPRVARFLQAQLSAHENVHVVQQAISGQGEESTLYVYNVAERSSLRKPTGLLELYPGLRVVEKIPVTSYSVGSLIKEFAPKNTGELCLIIDTPGEELSILEALVRDNMHERISSLVLRCAQAQLYEGAASRESIVELLDVHGFEIVEESGNSDFKPVLMLRLNRWKLQNGRLQARLGSLSADQEALHQAFSRETAKLRDVVSKKDAELQALAAKGKKYEHDSAEQQDLLRQEFSRETIKLRDVISKKDAELQALAAKGKKYEHDSAEQQDLLRQEFSRETIKLRDVISKKDAELQALAEKSKRYEHDSAEQQGLLKEEIEQLRRETKSQEVALDNARRDLGIALRVQVLRENDLKELQQRYSAVLDLKNSQHKLLMKLQERLSVAAEYLQQLKRDNQGEADDQLAQFLVRALTDGTSEK